MLIDLNTNDVALVLNILAERPYKEVNRIIGKIHHQASEWVKKEQQPAEVNDGTPGAS